MIFRDATRGCSALRPNVLDWPQDSGGLISALPSTGEHH